MIDKTILDHFKKVDPILYIEAEKAAPYITIRKSDAHFSDLCESIISQQLSEKAGGTICGRFLELFPTNIATPHETLKFSIEDLRTIGVSRAKANYILDLAQKVQNHEVHLEKFKTMSDQDVISELTKVKGIGPWTAEMFLMSSLGREDVFSTGDLGLKRAIERLYNLKDPTTEKLLQISSKWAPYRTYASRVLWYTLK